MKCVEVIKKKCNWSVLGFDRIVNYWWKRVVILYEGIVVSFNIILMGEVGYFSWFIGGKINLIFKLGEFFS